MNYLGYITQKLKNSGTDSIIDRAITFLGDDYPQPKEGLRGFEIVDIWLDTIKTKWNIRISILNLSASTLMGKLEARKGGFVINLNKNLFLTQKRFTLAHEIAHILSYDTSKDWPLYAVKYSKNEEYFCDQLARSFLLPKSLIDFGKFHLEDLDETQIHLIRLLWQEFIVSPWQVMLKISDENRDNRLICVLWEYVQKESYLRLIEHNSPKGIFIPKNARVHLNNLFKRKQTNHSPEIAFMSNGLYKDFDLIELGTLYKKKLFTTAFPIKTSSATYVMQIIHT